MTLPPDQPGHHSAAGGAGPGPSPHYAAYAPVPGMQVPAQPPPKVRGSEKWQRIVGTGTTLAVVIGVTVFAVLAISGPTVEEAMRACETAFLDEMEAHRQKAGDIDGPEAGDTNGVDVTDAYEIDGGFEVNGTGHYTVVTPSLSLPGTVELTCTATQGDGRLDIKVVSRAATPG